MEADPVNPFDLTGRVAIVTGAGSPTGIGMATASLLAGLGAAVLVTSTTGRVQDRAAELRAAGRDAVGVAADLTDEAAAQRVVHRTLNRRRTRAASACGCRSSVSRARGSACVVAARHRMP